MANECLWCGAETDGPTFLFCSYWHKLNHRAALDNPLAYLYPQEWEYSFAPLPTEENKDG